MKKTLILLIASLLLAGCGTMGYPQSRTQRINAYMAANPNVPADKLALLKNGQVTIGMWKADVVAAWGTPRYQNISSGGFEQWVYGNPAYGANYLYFENDVLKSWQIQQ
jgi:hypothetical protein